MGQSFRASATVYKPLKACCVFAFVHSALEQKKIACLLIALPLLSLALPKSYVASVLIALKINHKPLAFSEPFNLSNTARSVFDPNVFQRIYAVIRKSWSLLQGTGNVRSILDKPL